MKVIANYLIRRQGVLKLDMVIGLEDQEVSIRKISVRTMFNLGGCLNYFHHVQLGGSTGFLYGLYMVQIFLDV